MSERDRVKSSASGTTGAGGNRGAADRISAIRRYHAIGMRALGKFDGGGKPGSISIDELATEAGVKSDTIRKARDFARSYTKRELEALIKLRDGRGMPLTWCHVRQLLPIIDRIERFMLQSKAAVEDWSVRELRAQIQARLGGKQSSGANSFARPKSPEDALRRLIELSESWLRYYKEVVDAGDAGYLARLSEMPEDGPRREKPDLLLTAETTIRRLGRAAARVAGRLSNASARIGSAMPDGAQAQEVEPKRVARKKDSRSRTRG